MGLLKQHQCVGPIARVANPFHVGLTLYQRAQSKPDYDVVVND
jgi:hypothetical protein